MRRAAVGLAPLVAALAGAATAQGPPAVEVVPRDPDAPPTLESTPRDVVEEVGSGNGAVLRALDRVAGEATDIEIATGASVLFGRIGIRLQECRFPLDTPVADAFARLEIVDLDGEVLFRGWMVASSPALSAMDHARYDVWVLRCRTP